MSKNDSQIMSEETTKSDAEGGTTHYDLFAGFDPNQYELMMMDGYDNCILGVVERFGQKPIVCYDKEKIIFQLESEGMDKNEAEDFFYFNQIGAWMGESTPCFISFLRSGEAYAKS